MHKPTATVISSSEIVVPSYERDPSDVHPMFVMTNTAAIEPSCNFYKRRPGFINKLLAAPASVRAMTDGARVASAMPPPRM